MGDVEIPETGVCADGREKGLKSDQGGRKRPSAEITRAQFISSFAFVRESCEPSYRLSVTAETSDRSLNSLTLLATHW
jgi:hypothetical protein